MHRPAVLAVLLVALALPAARAQGATIGINLSGGDASVGLIPAAAATNAPMARAFLIWPGTAQPDSDKLAAWDAIVNGWVRAGMKGVIVVTGSGQPPADVDAYASYVGTLARRYGSKVAAWEVWNEEDEQEWWGNPGGDPNLYAKLLQATYPKVHPYAPVIVGGLVGNDYEFLSKVYDAGGGGSFDGVGVHTDTACSIVSPDSFYRDPSTAVARYSFLGFRSVHDVMTAHGDGAKPIWMTEFGWNTVSGLCNTGASAGKKNAGVSEANQAAYLTGAVHCLSLYPYVTAALWFTLRDDAPPQQYGLLTTSYEQKPAYQAFVDAAAGRDPLAGQGCGDFDGPMVSIKSPLPNGQFFGPLSIDVEGADNNGVGRISLFADGNKIRNFGSGATSSSDYPKMLRGQITWQGAKRLANGAHVIKVVVLDGAGNTSSQSVTVQKVDPGSLKQITTVFTPLKISGSGRHRRVSTTLKAAVMGITPPFRAFHKIHVYFQKLSHGKWKTAHKYTKSAKAPVKLSVSLEKAKWRVQAVFNRKAPFRSARTKYTYFNVR